MTNQWRGQYYRRIRGKDIPNWRNRNDGTILKNPPKLVKRKGMRNKAVIFTGSRFIGVEKTGMHFFNSDPKKSASAKRRFETQVRANKPSAIKRRSAHIRKI